MKHRYLKYLLVIFVAVAVLMPNTGCVYPKGRTVKAVQFDTLQTVYNSTLAVYESFTRRAVHNLEKPEKVQRVNKAWDTFNDAYDVTVQSLLSVNAPTPASVQRLADDVLAAIKSL